MRFGIVMGRERATAFDPKPQAQAFLIVQQRLRLRLRVKQFTAATDYQSLAGLFDVDNHAGDVVFRTAVEGCLDHGLGTLLRIVIPCQDGLNGQVIDAVCDAV